MVRRDYTLNGQDSVWYDGEYSNVEAIVNAGSADIYGISALGVLNLGPYFKVKSSITWMKGEDDEGYRSEFIKLVRLADSLKEWSAEK